jgi:flavin reductase (DIM6/NTAB) family NADH-FMN oxidoreductase RutF
VRNGRGLRHYPVVAPAATDVRVLLHGLNSTTTIDVTSDNVPVSLRPLILGVRLDTLPDREPTVSMRCWISFEDGAGRQFGWLRAAVTGALPMSRGALWLIKPSRCRNRCSPAWSRWVRYALAWQHARRAHARDDRLCMSAADLRCLNLYYSVARPVYLVGAASGSRANLFPMDLVGLLSTGEFLLALRATSPAIELMEHTRHIALSTAPADRLSLVYALGQHHKKETVDISQLPFAVQPSPRFGLPSLPDRLSHELRVERTHRIGSHVLFVSEVETCQRGPQTQLAHVSAMYAEYLSRRGRHFVPAS